MKLTATQLENPWVRLEPLAELHRASLQPLANDETLWLETNLNASGDGFNPWFDAMVTASTQGQQVSYAAYDKRSERYAGHTSFLAITPAHQRVEIGWTWYGVEFHRSHVNPACKRLLLGEAFDQGAERVELKTGSQNKRSQGAMEKKGARREGTLRSHTLTWTGARRDSVYFSILKAEWPGVKDGLDARLQRV